MARTLLRIAILCGIISWICGAQEFEVASIKPAPPRVPFSAALGLLHFRADDLRFEQSNARVIGLISLAYGIRVDRISGPGWMDEQEFAVEAKLPAGSTKEEIPAMFQKLLADRFRLTLHRDQRVEPVYDLVVDKKGAKLKASTVGEPGKGCMGRPGQTVCRGMTLGQFADFVSGRPNSAVAMRIAAMEQPGELTEHRIDRLVVDETGLTGLYDIDLEWVPPNGLPAPIPGAGEGFPQRDAAAKANSIFDALEAVGLKLQVGKHAFDTLVVDRVERMPTEN